MDLKSLSHRLTEVLGLDNKAVGIKIVLKDQEPPASIIEPEDPLRHCISIHDASEGAVYYLPEAKHACGAGAAALGIAELPPKVKSGKVPYMHGLAASEEAAARIMAEIPRIPIGSVRGTLVGPLDNIDFEPDIVIILCKPVQAMWIANSYLFREGGPRITANFAGMQACCGDATAVPYISGKVNFTPGCYGCRSAGRLSDDRMYVGMPVGDLPQVVENMEGLQRAMGNMNKNQPDKCE